MAALAIPASPLASQKPAPDHKADAPSAARPASRHRQFPDVLEDVSKREDDSPETDGDGTAPSLFNTRAIALNTAAPVPLPVRLPDELTFAAATEAEPAAPAVATPIGDSALPPTTRKPAKNSLEQVLNLSSQIRRSALDPEAADPSASAGQPLTAPISVMQNPEVEPVSLTLTAVPTAPVLPASVGVQPPAAPVPMAQANRPGEPAGNALDPAVRTLSASAAETGDVAFALKLVADSALENAPDRNSPQPALGSPTSAASSESPSRPAAELAVLAVQSGNPPPAGNPSGDTSGKPDGRSHQESQREPEAAARPERQRKAEAVQANHLEGPSVPAARDGAQAPHSVATQTETVAQRSGSPSTKPSQAAQPAEPEPAPEPLKTQGAAREIRLEVAGGDRRVEVRLMERGGEVQVTVRTPDSRLAGTLRENLPVLTSRLTESGFRTETGQQASQDSNPQSRQEGREQPRDAEPRRPKAEEEQLNTKNKGKDFSWFMSTHR